MSSFVAGFCSLPKDVQHSILCLASADKATARQLRRVCRAFAAHACLTERSHTSLDLSSDEDTCCLPYLPRLRSIECPLQLLPKENACFVDSVLSTHLAAWPALTTLKFTPNPSGDLYPTHFHNHLHLAPQLLQLQFQAMLPDNADLHFIWELTRLQQLSLCLTIPWDIQSPPAGACPAFQHLSQLQLLTRLCYSDRRKYADNPLHPDNPLHLAFANAVGDLPGLQNLELGHWSSTRVEWENTCWQALM